MYFIFSIFRYFDVSTLTIEWSYFNLAVVGFPDILVKRDGANAVSNDMSTRWVLDVLDMSTDVSMDGGIFEDAVAGLVEGAVLENQVVSIAKQLLASQLAVDQTDILGMPCQVLAIEHGVVDGDVLTLPEGVLGDDIGMVNLYVLTILENVFGVALQMVNIDILGKHERVGAPM